MRSVRRCRPLFTTLVERARELGPRQDEAAERRGHRAAHLLDARMHELGDVQHLVVACADLALDAAEARGARLQVGDADHVVIGHGVRDIFCGLDGKQEAALFASARNIDVPDRR